MPLKLPDQLPAIELLKDENIFVMDTTRAQGQDIRPLRIAILNLMPIKITTETDFIRILSNTPLQVEIEFMKIKSHTSKNTPVEHMMAFYRNFEDMKKEKYDGLIVTGAPLEFISYVIGHLAFQALGDDKSFAVNCHILLRLVKGLATWDKYRFHISFTSSVRCVGRAEAAAGHYAEQSFRI